jgi:hypothetical protein
MIRKEYHERSYTQKADQQKKKKKKKKLTKMNGSPIQS